MLVEFIASNLYVFQRRDRVIYIYIWWGRDTTRMFSIKQRRFMLPTLCTCLLLILGLAKSYRLHTNYISVVEIMNVELCRRLFTSWKDVYHMKSTLWKILKLMRKYRFETRSISWTRERHSEFYYYIISLHSEIELVWPN